MKKTAETGGTVHIVQRMEPGGIQTLILDMIQACPGEAGRIYSLEAGRQELIDEWPLLTQFADRLTGFRRGKGLVPELARNIARHLREDKPRTVIAHHIGPMIYGVAGARLARICNIIHVEHDAWHYENRKHRLYAMISSRLLRPDHVAVSQQIATRMEKIIGKRNIHVIPPAIDTNRFQPDSRQAARALLGISPEARLVGSAGRFESVKAYDLLIDAVAMLPGDTHLALAGDGPERHNLEKRAAEKNITERVHFLGVRPDLEKIFPAFDLFCLSSHNEGLPRVVLEAQACDIPVVATDVGAMRDAVCPETGKLVRAGDARALAEGLRLQLAATIRTGATRDFLVARYSFENMMAAYHELSGDA